MPTTESNLEIRSGPIQMSVEQRQRRRMLIALGLLVVALAVLLFKDREFWFSSNESADAETIETPPVTAPATTMTATTTTTTAATPAPNPPSQAVPVSKPPAPPTVASRSKKPKSRLAHHQAPIAPAKATPTPVVQAPPAQVAQAAPPQAAVESSQASADGPVVTTTNRTILLPLEVEVQAGNQHRPLSATNQNSVKVDMQSTASAAFAGKTPAVETQPDPAITESAEARVTMSPGTAERITRSVKPDYPVLAKQMKVQGAVVLEALIDRTGNIEELHVLAGPTILATAAREAVRQWRFKPYYEHGAPVETEARITVNFTISTY
jgi:TonB family protein